PPRSGLPYPSHASLTTPAPTEIYTLSLHAALPISRHGRHLHIDGPIPPPRPGAGGDDAPADGPTRRPSGRSHGPARRPGADRCGDRKSIRLNSSHVKISYAVFCLKKKKYQHESLS